MQIVYIHKLYFTTPTSIDALRYILNENRNCRSDRFEETVDTHDFLIILMSLLSDEAYQDQLSFLPNGKLFIIKHNSFSLSLMPRYFNMSSFSEFMRVLKRSGFTQIKDPTISDSFPSFWYLRWERIYRNLGHWLGDGEELVETHKDC